MGKCIYCNNNAGFLSKRHKKCALYFQKGLNEIKKKSNNAFDNLNIDFTSEFLKICSESYIPDQKYYELLAQTYSEKLELFLNDNLLSKIEETKLESFIDKYNLPKEYLENNNSLSKTIQASILRDVFEGNKINSRLIINGSLPFKLMKSEQLIYLFQEVTLFEQKIKTEYVGKSQGLSIKVAKGIYYRTGSFKGNPLKTINIEPISTGLLALTNKHLYFSSSLKNFRIKFDRIITIDQYTDAIGIQKEGVSSKPIVFKNLDGWFCYNYIKNI